MRIVRVQRDDFDIAAECRAFQARRTDIGAVVTFTGVVRSDGGLTALTIEHYPGMTEREIEWYIGEAERRWQIRSSAVIHRIGRLLPGEHIVLVAMAAQHRAAAFSAAEFVMDYLKTAAPFWKMEEFGASTVWVEARRSDDEAALRWRR